ncbi:AbrB family transcriptional regulator [Asaia astilbis]|uniref:AbrB family transcriptional regulator n=1 Tax=Asaia astilbis TaxID=610244 RepID=UPI0004711F01|nr:AbrB family transcriptional regulator [Asaia astilbis]
MIGKARLLALLGALSVLFAWGLTLAGFPAAFLVGPMVAAILLAVSGATIPLDRRLPPIAQAIIGQLMAHSLTLRVLHEVADHWVIFLSGVFSVIILSFTLGWVLARLRVMPGNVALWGASPGAATAMTLLCETYGADQRLVAFMAYLRVLLVTLATSLISHFVAGTHAHGGLLPVTAAPALPWWPCLAVVAATLLIAPVLRLGAAPLLLGLAGGLIVQTGFGFHYRLPVWLLAPSYVVIGWMIGRRFTQDVLRHVWRALPAVTLSTGVLIGGCALLSWPLAHIAHVDLLSAYLATSPGGADSVAIIAASTPIDMPFVMAMQIARFMVLMLIAPGIATFLTRFLPDDPLAASSQAGRKPDNAC